MEADFSGYATKNGLVCSDGRTIMTDAFKHQDKRVIPLVWQHQHGDPVNVLGHALLENRPDGVYTYGFFNNTPNGKHAKSLVQHGDVNGLSIFANKLVEKGKQVQHGNLIEVSLVLAGANPGAFIDNVNLAHGDGATVLDEEAVIYTGLTLEHEDAPDLEELIDDVDKVEQVEETKEEPEPVLTHAESKGASTMAPAAPAATADEEETLADIVNGMSEKQKAATAFLVGEAAKGTGDGEDAAVQHGETINHFHLEGPSDMTRNVFSSTDKEEKKGATLSHSQIKTIIDDGEKYGSFSESLIAHAGEYGITDIEYLFPDARTLTNSPDFLSRRMEWVQDVLSSTRHAPFSRIKSIAADITADDARAKGYVKGNLKKDEVIKLLRRVTTAKTIYKKQKLDRDDIIEITDIDVVIWLKQEMRLMLDEELAAAILVGDGRESDDEDKIDEDHIRPIAFDDDMYTTKVELDASPTPSEMVEAFVRSQNSLKGSGTPTLYTTNSVLTDMILDKDTLGRRFYATEQELAAALRVSKIVVVEAMERAPGVIGILVNLADYTIGADKGGEVNMFDDFDIDYNQQKYLIETRVSGALTRPKSAVALMANSGTVVTPNAPTFVSGTGVITIPAQTGVVYKNKTTSATLTAGAQTALASGASLEVVAVPAATYSFPHNFDADWEFTRP